MKKNNKKGFLLPPAVGYSLQVIFFLLASYSTSVRFFPRLVMTLLINLINWPFRVYEKLIINRRFRKKPIKEDPIFILGHWRSGTTHLHNILCQDPQMAYTTTFQSVFPDTLFNKVGRFLFEGFAKLLIPGTRKGDNVTLGTELPQEEEFALGDKSPVSFYYFWMFPKYMLKLYDDFIRFANVDNKLLDSWKDDYQLLIKKAIRNTGRKRYLSKNPPNTGRIKVLLEMFPNAKFIHIHRNPVEVYLSTQNFFNKMLPHLQLQSEDKEVLEANIFKLYKKLIKDYLDQKELIPEENLIELSFDNLEKNTQNCIEKIYSDLGLPGYDVAEPEISRYLEKMKSYEKNKHLIDAALLEKILSEWGFAMEYWNYKVPNHIETVV